MPRSITHAAVGRRYIPVLAACLAAASVSASPIVKTETPQPTSSEYPAHIETDHYAIWGVQGVTDLTRVGAMAEELYEDFMQSFGSKMQPASNAGRLTIACWNGPIPIANLGGRKMAVPGFYNSWNRVASVMTKFSPAPFDQLETRVRHEATHQLVHATFGLQAIQNDRGFWYREGLACYFEGTGKYRLNGGVRLFRLGVVERYYDKGGLPTINELIELDATEDGSVYSLCSYSLAWSFCHFLMHGERGVYRDRFIAFLDNLREWNVRGRNTDLFRDMFRDFDKLQEGWVKHVYLLQRASDTELAAALEPVGDKPHLPSTEQERKYAPKLESTEPDRAQSERASRELVESVWALLKKTEFLADSEVEKELTSVLTADSATVSALATIFTRGNENAQLLAARALAFLRARRALPFLVGHSLDHRSEAVRKACARAVGAINYGIAPLTYYSRIHRAGPNTMIPVVKALGEIGDEYAVDSLISILKQAEKPPSVGVSSGQYMVPSGPPIGPPGTRITFRNARSGSTRVGLGKSSQYQELIGATVEALNAIVPDHSADSADVWLEWASRR